MPLIAQITNESLFSAMAMGAIFACVAVWANLVARRRRRQPVLPYQPRRPVPWGIADVVFVMLIYFTLPSLFFQTARGWFDIPIVANVQNAEAPSLDATHPLARVLLESHDARIILLCVVLGVVITPITEELLFRLLLQGWLEALERRVRKRFPLLKRLVAGILPVALVSLMFAALHYRIPEPSVDLSVIVFAIGALAVSSLLTIVLLVCWLKFAAGATLADFGIVPKRLATDVKLGLLAFLAILVPVYALMLTTTKLLPKGTVADPIPLLLLAAVLGTLYYRTHRIVPAIVLHMAFNAMGVILAILASC